MKSLYYNLTSMALITGIFSSCQNTQHKFDASGVFEATEHIISAEVGGKILELTFEEGDELKPGQFIGKIDCELLDLQKAQVKASMIALSEKQFNAEPQMEVIEKQIKVQDQQIATLEEQIKTAEKEKVRIEKLVKAEAAPTKQLDDVNAQLSVLNKQLLAAEAQTEVLKQQMKAQKQTIAIQNRGILSEEKPLNEKISQIEAQIKDCQIQNPIAGKVLNKYAEQYEMATPGKPIYKIADTKKMILRAYISGNQLPMTKLGQYVKVYIDDAGTKYREVSGKIIWIASKAEFTPKTIQTKDERANLVYAVKIAVDNSDESIKIGMYGEIKLSK
jgi:HlyD family secretion protein